MLRFGSLVALPAFGTPLMKLSWLGLRSSSGLNLARMALPKYGPLKPNKGNIKYLKGPPS